MQPNYYAIIPANVRYDKNLPPNAKLLYGEITALTNEKGYCWATNDYFAQLYGTSKITVSRWVKALVDGGYITTKLVYKEGTKEIKNRFIWIVTPTFEEPINKNVNTSYKKNNEPINKNVNSPINKNVKENNTSINNTINNTNNNICAKSTYDSSFEKFWTVYPRKINKKKASAAFKKAIKRHSLEEILSGTEKYAIQTKNTDKQYIKHPTTFLNDDSFIDGYEEIQTNNQESGDWDKW